MNQSVDQTYRMTVGLNVLKHLGLGLYSNVPAVLAEAVANAWDADAEEVTIEIDQSAGRITITDDGHGMTVDDVNSRYLNIGYERRKAPGGATSPRLNRPVMGRKGIGKLSLFSIANVITLQTRRSGEAHGFLMSAADIEAALKEDSSGEYYPSQLGPKEIDLLSDSGTKITLTGLKRQLYLTSSALRRRIARRFSIIGEEYSFRVVLDGTPITIEDRGYHDKLEYIWVFGNRGEKAAAAASQLEKIFRRPVEIGNGGSHRIEGWIGTARKAGDLKDDGENLNKILVMVRDKLAQEDILEEFGEGGVYSKYLIGEIHADFLDSDDAEDIATTSRQRIIEEDPRYRALREKVRDEVKIIQSEWTDLRNQTGTTRALTIPQIDKWFQSLDLGHQAAARRLFGRINELPIDDPSEKRQLFISSILAFEGMRFRQLIDRIKEVSAEDLEAVGRIFGQLDDLEASAYYQISRDRLAVIDKLTDLVDDDAKERVMQEHLFQHLWLLDPSWERATHTEMMERRVETALRQVSEELTDEQRRSRVDIQYSTTGGKHVVIELKRAGRILESTDLIQQVQKYNGAIKRVLDAAGRRDDALEIICVIGKPLRDWSDPDGREQSARGLEAFNARVVMYDALIENAQQAYRDYLERRREAGRVHELITSIAASDVEAMHATMPRPATEDEVLGTH